MMELAAWQTKTVYRSTFDHVKPDQNKWADDLTHHLHAKFNSSLQIKTLFKAIKWQILEELFGLHESYLGKPSKKKKVLKGTDATPGEAHDQV